MKMFQPQLIETRQATVERKSPGLVEIRFKPDVKLDAAGVAEVIQAKRELCAMGEPDVLAVLVPDMDMDMKVVTMDHRAMYGDCVNSRRLALAAHSEMNRKLAEIHFRYHPRPHDTGIFLGEEEARAWLAKAPQLN